MAISSGKPHSSWPQLSLVLGAKMDKIENLVKILRGEDDLGVVIRSHIIAEQYLNALIESLLKAPEHYKKMKLDYSETVFNCIIQRSVNPAHW